MDNIAKILERKKLTQTAGRINTKFEEAKEFLEYIGITPDRGNCIFILGLCKKFGAGQVYGLRSYLKDARFDPSRIKGLFVHLLKERLAEKEKKAEAMQS